MQLWATGTVSTVSPAWVWNITEALAAQIEPEINRYREAGLPAIILIPGISGNTGKGILAVKKSVEQAVGSDIIFNGQ